MLWGKKSNSYQSASDDDRLLRFVFNTFLRAHRARIPNSAYEDVFVFILIIVGDSEKKRSQLPFSSLSPSRKNKRKRKNSFSSNINIQSPIPFRMASSHERMHLEAQSASRLRSFSEDRAAHSRQQQTGENVEATKKFFMDRQIQKAKLLSGLTR